MHRQVVDGNMQQARVTTHSLRDRGLIDVLLWHDGAPHDEGLGRQRAGGLLVSDGVQ